MMLQFAALAVSLTWKASHHFRFAVNESTRPHIGIDGYFHYMEANIAGTIAVSRSHPWALALPCGWFASDSAESPDCLVELCCWLFAFADCLKKSAQSPDFLVH